jgi:hypothetical protein
MSLSEAFSLVLSCGGYEFNNMVLCSSTINVIIDFDRHMEDIQNEKTMDFLDQSCSLFDGPMTDWNKITNTLKMLKERFGLIDDKKWLALYSWLPLHKKCGASLILCLNDNLDELLLVSKESSIGITYFDR